MKEFTFAEKQSKMARYTKAVEIINWKLTAIISLSGIVGCAIFQMPVASLYYKHLLKFKPEHEPVT